MMLSRSLLTLFSLAATAAATAIPRADTTCTNPEVRKEWRELTTTEKAEYIRAAVCLRNLPKAKYAAIDALHEDLLRSECGFKGTQPYWDWSIDADALDTQHSPVFDPVTGFGGDGKRTGSDVPGFQRCVVDGPFANTNLTLAMGWPDMNTPGNRLHCFTREFNGGEGNDANGDPIIGDMQAGAYNSRTMNTIYGFDRFPDMVSMLEGLPHAQIHSIIFGDMGPATSPNEPLFFLHHGNVDRAWAKWQGRNATRLTDYAGFNNPDKTISASITDTMPVLELVDVEPVVKDYMDTLSGPLCYTYSSM
ncbi:hypothetical protein HER10_EVM0007937 [Colletotrichum scovillei]|uniref:uncharacterized protein n=1 Tax=Colletotrichum scovillei TaxID=1209932 RepID=UPI0015C3F243|nr:uncharacterized protein HER10_EVM0007937 [Colletotrichum scovillei]KAF4773246.1 hypothetical protein HER10_EVM0007937 [Colletotrichum scovillei]